MANIKSAKKRILVNRTKAARNKAIKSAVKTSMKKVDAAVANKDKAAAEVALKDAVSTISKATSKGGYHKNNCADVYKRQLYSRTNLNFDLLCHIFSDKKSMILSHIVQYSLIKSCLLYTSRCV